jgi:predicted extracellular nuclease
MPLLPRPTLAALVVATLLLGALPRPAFTRHAPTRTFDIQGSAHRSPLMGQTVNGVAGVVTVTRTNGFFLQDPDGDGDPATSDAVFVFTREAPGVSVGDGVVVSGQVEEFRPGDDENNLTLTEIVSPRVSVRSRGNPLPVLVVIGSGGRTVPARLVAEDMSGDVETASRLQPDASAIDFYESLEGMRVQVNDAVVVGPRGSRGDLPVLPDDGAGAANRTARGGLLMGSPDAAPPIVMLTDGAVRTPPAGVGERLPGTTIGVVDYAFGQYALRLTELPSVVLGGLEPERAAPARPEQLSVATFNVENLSPRDRPAKAARLASIIVEHLGSPDLIVAQEIQDDTGPDDDGTVTATRTARLLIEAVQAAGGPTYAYREIAPANDQDGGQPGGNIRVGFFFRPDRGIAFVDRPGGDATTPTSVVAEADGVHPSLSPGRVQPDAPAWTDSRKPLVGEFAFNGRRLVVIGNHFVSKLADGPAFGRFQPPPRPSEAQCVEQAGLVNAFVGDLLAADPSALAVVLGDLNDGPTSATLATLRSDLLTNLLDLLPDAERYSYVFGGQSEAIDQILVSPALLAAAPEVDVVHVNAEFVGGASDHDPVLARFTFP